MYPIELDGLGLYKAESFIIDKTFASKNCKSGKLGNRFSRNEALHVKPAEYGKFLDKTQSAVAKAQLRLDWTQKYLDRRYGKGRVLPKSAIDMLGRATRLLKRCVSCLEVLEERGPWIRTQLLSENYPIDTTWANHAVVRARQRADSKHVNCRCNVTTVDINALDVLEASRRFSPDGLCPVLGEPMAINQGGRAADTSPSLHRVDASGQYTSGNIAVISCRANSLIQDLSSVELGRICSFYEKTGDERLPLYENIRDGQARLEAELGITPRDRGSFRIAPDVWFDAMSGRTFYQASA